MKFSVLVKFEIHTVPYAVFGGWACEHVRGTSQACEHSDRRCHGLDAAVGGGYFNFVTGSSWFDAVGPPLVRWTARMHRQPLLVCNDVILARLSSTGDNFKHFPEALCQPFCPSPTAGLVGSVNCEPGWLGELHEVGVRPPWAGENFGMSDFSVSCRAPV